MKTFKLIELAILDNQDATEIPLESGLIINKEDENSNWLIEAYTDLSFFDYFRKLLNSEEEFIVQAVITNPENDPAFFQTRVCSLLKFESHISVLIEGRLRKTKNDYAEVLLGKLLNQGFDGNMLLNEFKDKMQRKPRIKR